MLLASLLLMTPLYGLMCGCGGLGRVWAVIVIFTTRRPCSSTHGVSLLAGIVSVSLAVLCGVLLSMSVPETSIDGRYALALDAVNKISLGLLGSVFVALFTGYLSAYFQAYPYFILLQTWP